MLTFAELNKMNPEQLQKALKEARTELAHMRMSIKGNQTRSIHLFHAQKRYIAQILTTLNKSTNEN